MLHYLVLGLLAHVRNLMKPLLPVMPLTMLAAQYCLLTKVFSATVVTHWFHVLTIWNSINGASHDFCSCKFGRVWLYFCSYLFQIYYYHPFSAVADSAKIYNDLRWNITRPQGFEAVMRVRCSQVTFVEYQSARFLTFAFSVTYNFLCKAEYLLSLLTYYRVSKLTSTTGTSASAFLQTLTYLGFVIFSETQAQIHLYSHANIQCVPNACMLFLDDIWIFFSTMGLGLYVWI